MFDFSPKSNIPSDYGCDEMTVDQTLADYVYCAGPYAVFYGIHHPRQTAREIAEGSGKPDQLYSKIYLTPAMSLYSSHGRKNVFRFRLNDQGSVSMNL